MTAMEHSPWRRVERARILAPTFWMAAGACAALHYWPALLLSMLLATAVTRDLVVGVVRSMLYLDESQLAELRVKIFKLDKLEGP